MVTIEGQEQLVKGKLLCAVMDLPAKASLLNVVQIQWRIWLYDL